MATPREILLGKNNLNVGRTPFVLKPFLISIGNPAEDIRRAEGYLKAYTGNSPNLDSVRLVKACFGLNDSKISEYDYAERVTLLASAFSAIETKGVPVDIALMTTKPFSLLRDNVISKGLKENHKKFYNDLNQYAKPDYDGLKSVSIALLLGHYGAKHRPFWDSTIDLAESIHHQINQESLPDYLTEFIRLNAKLNP